MIGRMRTRVVCRVRTYQAPLGFREHVAVCTTGSCEWLFVSSVRADADAEARKHRQWHRVDRATARGRDADD